LAPMAKLTIELEDEVAKRVADEAADRGVAPEELAGEILAAKFSARRHLSFAGAGASGAARGAANADELLADGFGHDSAC